MKQDFIPRAIELWFNLLLLRNGPFGSFDDDIPTNKLTGEEFLARHKNLAEDDYIDSFARPVSTYEIHLDEVLLA